MFNKKKKGTRNKEIKTENVGSTISITITPITHQYNS